MKYIKNYRDYVNESAKSGPVDIDKVYGWIKNNVDKQRVWKIVNHGISDGDSDKMMKRVNKDLRFGIDTDDYKSKEFSALDSAISDSIKKRYSELFEAAFDSGAPDSDVNESKENWVPVKDKDYVKHIGKKVKNFFTMSSGDTESFRVQFEDGTYIEVTASGNEPHSSGSLSLD